MRVSCELRGLCGGLSAIAHSAAADRTSTMELPAWRDCTADLLSTRIAIFGILAWTGIPGFAPQEAQFKRLAISTRYGEIISLMTTGATQLIRTLSPPCMWKPVGTAPMIRSPRFSGWKNL